MKTAILSLLLVAVNPNLNNSQPVPTDNEQVSSIIILTDESQSRLQVKFFLTPEQQSDLFNRQCTFGEFTGQWRISYESTDGQASQLGFFPFGHTLDVIESTPQSPFKQSFLFSESLTFANLPLNEVNLQIIVYDHAQTPLLSSSFAVTLAFDANLVVQAPLMSPESSLSVQLRLDPTAQPTVDWGQTELFVNLIDPLERHKSRLMHKGFWTKEGNRQIGQAEFDSVQPGMWSIVVIICRQKELVGYAIRQYLVKPNQRAVVEFTKLDLSSETRPMPKPYLGPSLNPPSARPPRVKQGKPPLLA